MSSAYYSPLVSDDLIWEVARMFYPRMNSWVVGGREGGEVLAFDFGGGRRDERRDD